MNTSTLATARPRLEDAGRLARRLVLCVLLPATLAACGQGGGGAAGDPLPVATSETVSGPVTGFGSVIVEGVRYDDERAVVVVDVDPTAPKSATTTELGLGMQVEVEATGETADRITVSATVIGRVQSVAGDGFVVAGQTVAVSTDPAAPTWFEGVDGIAGLAIGDRVEVHGSRDAAGVIVATRIEIKDPRATPVVRIVGTVGGLDPAGTSFTIGDLLIAVGDATRIVPAGQTLANGQLVVVFSGTPVIGNRLEASAIRITRRQVETGSMLRIGGRIRALDFATTSFALDGFAIDAAGATFVNGTAADLANGRAVRVIGRFEGGVVAAREVRFRRLLDGEHAVGLTGAIGNFVSAGSFTIRGVPIDASGSGVVFVGGNASNLGDGVVARIEGDVDGNVVRAVRVTFADTSDGRTRGLVGLVAGYDASAGTFRIGNAAMRLGPTTTWRNADFSDASVADFGNDDRVQVRGQWRGGVFEVAEVIFRPGVDIVITRTSGSVYSLEATGGAFRVNGVLVRVDGSTAFSGSRENLRNGAKVTVEGRLENGRLVAVRVVVDPA